MPELAWVESQQMYDFVVCVLNLRHSGKWHSLNHVIYQRDYAGNKRLLRWHNKHSHVFMRQLCDYVLASSAGTPLSRCVDLTDIDNIVI
jgi:hypothetical protein